jgi:regulator of protease activity HflC (stomatin/prohibitin superfamily)
MFRRVRVRSDEAGLYFREGEFEGLLGTGKHWLFDPFGRARVDVVSRRDPFLTHEKLDLIVKSGVLADLARVVDLNDDQRALAWVDGRFHSVLLPGQYAYWTSHREVRVEVVDARTTRFEHPAVAALLRHPRHQFALDMRQVAADHVGVLFYNGRYVETLPPGRYAFWRNGTDVRLEVIDMRETTVDVGGQEIMTADRVTLRLNAQVSYRVADARQAVAACDDVRQAIYREAQLALRAIVGGRPLDDFLSARDGIAREAEGLVRGRAEELGLEVVSVGVRDVILPGEMKTLLNRVTEAKAAAEANLISRREETAAIRSQANTAKLLENNPTLMRLRELELLEKLVTSGHVQVVLGEKGLADRIVNML